MILGDSFIFLNLCDFFQILDAPFLSTTPQISFIPFPPTFGKYLGHKSKWKLSLQRDNLVPRASVAFPQKASRPADIGLLYLTLSGQGGGGGGGLRGPNDQTHSCQSETTYSMMPKLGDF